MSPTGGETGKRNAQINAQLWLWNERTRLGEIFDSSTGFALPKGADRSPDAAWVEQSRWDALTPAQKEKWLAKALAEYQAIADSLQHIETELVCLIWH